MSSRTVLRHLGDGDAFVDLSSWRAVEVSGSDAREWLDDLVSARLGTLGPGRAVPSLLLSPTGGIQAAFTAIEAGESVLLVQDPRQPRSIAGLLEPYVLSSDVRIAETRAGVFAFPGRAQPPASHPASAPSCTGAGLDVVTAAADRDRTRAELEAEFATADAAALEAWRVAAAIPAVGVDTMDGDLPQEVGLEHLVSFDKGCFLGQEAVARSRNLGHPRRWLLPVESEADLRPGDEIVVGDGRAGVVTSAAPLDDAWVGFVRVAWSDREEPMRTTSGAHVRPRVRPAA